VIRIEDIAQDGVLDDAYDWLCRQRLDYSANNDVWDLRRHWATVKPELQAGLNAGSYRFGALERIRGKDGIVEVWPARDALVLKAMALVLARGLEPHLSKNCYHLKGHGGAKGAVQAVADGLGRNSFVLRTDVKSYYASIDQEILLAQLRVYIDDPRLLSLLRDYMQHTVYDGGIYEDVWQGIPLGCPLSPLMGALYLKLLDDRVEKLGLTYVRFMDDWVILAPTRWKLRAAVKVVNQTLRELKLEKHQDKTFIGRISRGFDFLGFTFSPSGVGVACKTIGRFAERLSRLYEQGADTTPASGPMFSGGDSGCARLWGSVGVWSWVARGVWGGWPYWRVRAERG
jgi:RNA-directed DNA polymerase